MSSGKAKPETNSVPFPRSNSQGVLPRKNVKHHAVNHTYWLFYEPLGT